MDLIAVWFILVYALAVSIGGVFGYFKAKSKISLITGCVSGIALLGVWVYSFSFPSVGLVVAAAIASVLLVVFITRFFRTRKFIPAGVMAILSLVAAIVFILGWLAI